MSGEAGKATFRTGVECRFYKRIALVNYEQSVQVQHGEPAANKTNEIDRNNSGGSIWDEAMNFYNPGNNQKGAVN